MKELLNINESLNENIKQLTEIVQLTNKRVTELERRLDAASERI